MNAPGTPAIALPAYAAPAFSGATVAYGAVVTTFTLESDAPRKNVPFTFGQPFKPGQLAPSDSLVGRVGTFEFPLQVDAKATHADGSLRHAIISGVWPSLAAGDTVISLVRAPEQSVTPHAFTAAPMSAVATIAGVEYLATPSGDGAKWLSGPVAAERIFDAPLMRDGVPHPDLIAKFYVRSFVGGMAKIDIAVEHTKAYSLTGDITYDAKIIVDGVVRYEQAGLVHFPHSRWKKSVCIGYEPVHIKHDIDYLIDTKAVSNYDRRVKPSEKLLASYAAKMTGPTFVPMGCGPFQKAMRVAGGRPEIGIAPDSYVVTILTMDKRAKAMMLASADAAGSWSSHRRDDSNGPAAGRPLDIIHFPRSTVRGTISDSKNRETGQFEKLPLPVSSSGYQNDSPHQPGFAYIPYLLTGDYYYLEELHFWVNCNLYSMNPGYRDGYNGIFKGDEVRGQAWTLRTLAEAAYVTPDDHPAKPAVLHWMQTNLATYSGMFLEGGTDHNKLGIVTSGPAVVYLAGTAMSPWMDDFFTSAVSHAVELGFDGFKPLLKWKAQFPIGRMIDPGYCWIEAAVYALKVRDSATAPIYTTLGECYNATFDEAHRATACGSPERLAYMNSTLKRPAPDMLPGQMTGYAWSTTGYPANMQPSLAGAVDVGLPGSALAWERFDKRAMQPDYASSPQFAIVPRTVASVIAQPDPAPVIVPTPTPTPVPVPVPVPTPVPVPVPVPTPLPVPEPEPTPTPVPPVAKSMTVSVSITSDEGKVIAFSFPVTVAP